MFTELDVRAAAVAFAARGQAIGVQPLVVMLCPPGREDEGWRKFAVDYLLEVAKARHEGRTPPGINTYPLRKHEDYDAVE